MKTILTATLLCLPVSLIALGPVPNNYLTPSELNPRVLDQYATTKFQATESEILMDNDSAFQAKLDVVSHAKWYLKEHGQSELYLNYYIFNTDESSSYLASKIVEAAKQGVKVYITLDILQAYTRLDFYRWMADSSQGNIKFFFYGRPTNKMLLDAIHLASPCLDDNNDNLLKKGQTLTACTSQKQTTILKKLKVEDFNGLKKDYKFPSQLMSGVYAKNPKLIVDAILSGNQISLEELKGDGSNTMDAKTKESLLEFAQLLLKSKTTSGAEKLFYALKLRAALLLYKDQLQPLYNLLTGIIPFTTLFDSADESNKRHLTDWNYFTDYTHHKLILSNDDFFVLGGRNIENSYHMGPNSFSDKYIFMDTDMSFKLRRPNAALGESQRKIHNFNALVIPMEELLEIMPNDLDGAIDLANEICSKNNELEDLDKCIKQNTLVLAQNYNSRFKHWDEKIKQGAKNYLAYKNSIPGGLEQRISLDEGAEVYYLENLHFSKEAPSKRIFGVTQRPGHLAAKGKNINELWLRAMENLCKYETKQEIYLYNAYFLPSANFVKSLSKMIDGSYDCKNVGIHVVTNSIETTDLDVINVFARHWLRAFSYYYLSYQDHSRGAQLHYYEYDKDALSMDPNIDSSFSLHSKVSLFGDKQAIVGSANADVRSYARDTNNGVFLDKAPKLVKEFKSFIYEHIGDGKIKKLPISTLALSKEVIDEADYTTFAYMNAGRCIKKKLAITDDCRYLDENQFESAYKVLAKTLTSVFSQIDQVSVSPRTYVDRYLPDFHYSRDSRFRIKNHTKRKQKSAIDRFDFSFGLL